MIEQSEHLDFDWEDTGKLDVEIIEGQSATLRFAPSMSFIDSTLAKFRSTSHNQRKQNDNPISSPEAKMPQNPSHSLLEAEARRVKMEDTNTEFKELSVKSHDALKSGRLDQYVIILEQMSKILNLESKRTDELKLLMIAFYVRLNCPIKRMPLNIDALQQAKYAADEIGLTPLQIKKIYFDAISENITPIHRITVKGSYRLFDLCMRGLWERARIIISKLEE